MKRNVWYLLVRAHDHVWRDREAAKLLWELSLRIPPLEVIEL